MTLLEAEVRLVPSPAGRALVVLGYPDVFAAADHVPEILALRPDRPGGDRRPARRRHEEEEAPPRAAEAPPRRAGLPARGVRRATIAARRWRTRAALMAALGRRSRPPAMKLYDDPAEEQHRLEGARVGARRDRPGPGRARHLGGLGGLGGRAGEARRLPPRAPRAARPVRLRGRALRPLRPGLRPHPHHFDLTTRGGIAPLPRLRRRGGRPRRVATAARSRASTATASRAASSCRRCSARSWSRPSASSRRSGTPSGR